MKVISVIVVTIAVTLMVLLCPGTTEARGSGVHNRRRYRDSSESESNEDRRHYYGKGHGRGRHWGRQEVKSSESEEDQSYRIQGRGWFDDLGSLVKKAAVTVYDEAKKVDWKGVATKTKNIGAAMINEAKKSRKKRSYETMPLPAEQVISDYLDDQTAPKTLYKKRSVRKFNMKAYQNPKNQLNYL